MGEKPPLNIKMHKYTVFTWLNAAATITPVTKIDAATIRGRHLLHSALLHAATTQTYSNSKKFQVCCAIMFIP